MRQQVRLRSQQEPAKSFLVWSKIARVLLRLSKSVVSGANFFLIFFDEVIGECGEQDGREGHVSTGLVIDLSGVEPFFAFLQEEYEGQHDKQDGDHDQEVVESDLGISVVVFKNIDDGEECACGAQAQEYGVILDIEYFVGHQICAFGVAGGEGQQKKHGKSGEGEQQEYGLNTL